MNHQPTIIQLNKVSKVYPVKPRASVIRESLTGLRNFVQGRASATAATKVALNNISLGIKSGEKVGIIGRNGSGKSTLLKVITGYTGQTLGQVTISGSIQAMMQTGFGFADELTGFQNIQNSLLFNGLSAERRQTALADIVNFVELGEFLHYPLKTYSLGMKARLEFATATAIRPDIVVIDEILGAGDGYFVKKCAERMQQLIQKTTLLLVSHSMQQILEYCERTIWIDNGNILEDGSSKDVINAYTKFMREKNTHFENQANPSLVSTEKESALSVPPELEETRNYSQNKSLKTLSSSSDNKPLVEVTGAGFGEDWHSYCATETGDPLQINVRCRHLTESLSRETGDEQALSLNVGLYGFTVGGSLIWESRSECQPRQKACAVGYSESVIKVSLPRLPIGVGDYWISIGVNSALTDELTPSSSLLWEEKTTSIKHSHLFLRVLPTNISDPPFVHCPGTWYYGTKQAASEPARINAWC